MDHLQLENLVEESLVTQAVALTMLSDGLYETHSSGLRSKVDSDLAYAKPDFVKVLNDHCLNVNSDYCNEIFIYFYIKMFEYTRILKEYSNSSSHFLVLSFDAFIFFIARYKLGVTTILERCWFGLIFFFVIVLVFVGFIPVAFFVFAKTISSRRRSLERRDVLGVNAFYLIRSEAALNKLERLISSTDGASVLVDDFSFKNDKGLSIYSPLGWPSGVNVVASLCCYIVRDFYAVIRDSYIMLGIFGIPVCLVYYLVRIPQKALYESCLLQIIRSSSPNTVFYTGDKEDRFAMVQTRLASLFGLDLYCVPHGLEYGFKFPRGLSGSVFYCNSLAASIYLNDLYCENKFIFSQDIKNSMFNQGGGPSLNRVCFYTEPRDRDVNFKILDVLTVLDIPIYIKFHPLDNPDLYFQKYPDLNVLLSLEEALRSSVCLGRKSTVLLEAAHQGRKSIAVLISPKDRVYLETVFPALSADEIFKVYNLEDLGSLI